ncbi:hypothetical protein L6452_44734 [Arctium lappa]|nr:hypothetical protein L6452_44734 [Arctium lappa]
MVSRWSCGSSRWFVGDLDDWRVWLCFMFPRSNSERVSKVLVTEKERRQGFYSHFGGVSIPVSVFLTVAHPWLRFEMETGGVSCGRKYGGGEGSLVRRRRWKRPCKPMQTLGGPENGGAAEKNGGRAEVERKQRKPRPKAFVGVVANRIASANTPGNVGDKDAQASSSMQPKPEGGTRDAHGVQKEGTRKGKDHDESGGDSTSLVDNTTARSNEETSRKEDKGKGLEMSAKTSTPLHVKALILAKAFISGDRSVNEINSGGMEDEAEGGAALEEDQTQNLCAASEAEEAALRQRAKVHWLNDGNSNTKYFHHVVWEKRHTNFLHLICDAEGHYVYGDEVPHAFVEFFRSILGGHDDMV